MSKSATLAFQDSLILAGKNVVAGMIYGIIGIVQNPMQEYKISKKGLTKGIGKGISGFVVKPLGSLFDGISLSLDGLKRFAQSGSERITSTRLPRHLIKDIPIIPFSEYLAQGYEILRELQNDNIAVQESYWAHLFFSTRRSNEILYFITDTKVYQLQLTYTQILSKWKLVDTAIPLNKIDRIEISKVQTEIQPDFTSNSNKNRTRKKKSMVPGPLSEEMDEYNLFVIFEKGEIFDRKNPSMNKKLLIAADHRKTKWFSEKIECVIKYYKETRQKIRQSPSF